MDLGFNIAGYLLALTLRYPPVVMIVIRMCIFLSMQGKKAQIREDLSLFLNFFDGNPFESGFGSGQDPNTDPNAERTQWSGKHQGCYKGYFSVLEDATQVWPLCRGNVLYLFYFVLFYYPSIW